MHLKELCNELFMPKFFKHFSHCLRGRGGFQQRIPHTPVYPSYGNSQRSNRQYMGGYGMGRNPYQGQDTVCYSCMPGGDVRRRHRRSTDESEGRFIEVHDSNGKASLNTSYPIEIVVTLQNATRRTPLLELRSSIKQLKDHSRYQIVAGNRDRFFRIHYRDQLNVLHLTKNAIRPDGEIVIQPGEYDLQLRVLSTLDADAVQQSSFESETIEDALKETVQFDVKIYLDD